MILVQKATSGTQSKEGYILWSIETCWPNSSISGGLVHAIGPERMWRIHSLIDPPHSWTEVSYCSRKGATTTFVLQFRHVGPEACVRQQIEKSVPPLPPHNSKCGAHCNSHTDLPLFSFSTLCLSRLIAIHPQCTGSPTGNNIFCTGRFESL